ncbi:hypothetical protein V6N12_016359 [Hibiscus sabdariffa]|uniref:Uncharacterized protein n=1 Tax=Hibiscus sabdariffa TaxID=183260 RepID=A0ABR2CDU9_9ROSI
MHVGDLQLYPKAQLLRPSPSESSTLSIMDNTPQEAMPNPALHRHRRWLFARMDSSVLTNPFRIRYPHVAT